MARSGIDYGGMMHRAMQGLIADVLEGVAENGLPGEHHFFITFDTQHPDVELADWLSDRYPGEVELAGNRLVAIHIAPHVVEDVSLH